MPVRFSVDIPGRSCKGCGLTQGQAGGRDDCEGTEIGSPRKGSNVT